MQQTIDLSKLAFFAPNLPRFEVDRDKLWAWWDQVIIPIKRLQMDSRGNNSGYDGEFWDGVTVWQKEEYQQNIVWKVNYTPNDELFGDMIQRIIAALPWYDVQGVTLWSNKVRVAPHQDGLPRDPFPSAPRINLIDECDNRTFYLVKKEKLKLVIPDLQQGPNLFFFNNEKCFHGAYEPVNGRKILIRIDGPLVDRDGFVEYMKSQIEQGAAYE